MTREDIDEFLEANPDVVDHAVALVVRRDGLEGWTLVIGGRQADGGYRHVDAQIGDFPKIALYNLQKAAEDRP